MNEIDTSAGGKAHYNPEFRELKPSKPFDPRSSERVKDQGVIVEKTSARTGLQDQILEAIREKGSVTRADILERTGAPKKSIDNATYRLKRDGLIDKNQGVYSMKGQSQAPEKKVSQAHGPVKQAPKHEPKPESAPKVEAPKEKASPARPGHYVIKDGLEVVDVREWWLQGMEGQGDFTLAQISHLERAMEYLLRAPRKGGRDDMQKAYHYLHRALHGEWPGD